MKQLQLFTKKLYDKDLKPTQLRDGTKLLSFHCLPDAGARIFFGITADGRALSWKKDGHVNGGRNMKTDLIFYETDPDDVLFYVALGPNGKPYATSNILQLTELKMPVENCFEFILNTRTMDCIIDRAKYPIK